MLQHTIKVVTERSVVHTHIHKLSYLHICKLIYANGHIHLYFRRNSSDCTQEHAHKYTFARTQQYTHTHTQAETRPRDMHGAAPSRGMSAAFCRSKIMPLSVQPRGCDTAAEHSAGDAGCSRRGRGRHMGGGTQLPSRGIICMT